MADQSDPDGTRQDAADARPSLEFKLRLASSMGSGPADGAGTPRPAPEPRPPTTGARPALFNTSLSVARPVDEPAPAPVAAVDADPRPSGEVTIERTDGWDAYPSSVRAESEAREYRADAEALSIISQLADQITTGTQAATPTVTPAPTPSRPPSPTPSSRIPVLTPTGRTAAVVAEPPVAPATVDQAPVEPAAVDEPDEDDAEEQAVVEPAVAPAPVLAEPALVPTLAEVADAPEVDASTDPLTGHVAIPAIVEAVPHLPVSAETPAVPVASHLTGNSPVVVDRVSASNEHEVMVSRALPTIAPVAPAPAPAPAPLQLPSTPGKVSGQVQNKPVDFRALLNQSGFADNVVAKRRKQRHPFRVLFKLVLVLAVLGAGAYAAKKYWLDTRWPNDVKQIANDVSTQRGLSWDHTVKVVDLPAPDYALRLASSMLGLGSAQVSTVASEWRAMGLAQGNVDLGSIGAAAMADQPAFYDPVEQKVYQLHGLSPELRQVALTRALTNALLDQRFHWGARLDDASPSVQLGIRALFDGDALAMRSSVASTLLADPATASALTDELAALREQEQAFARGASPYAVALASMPGVAARHLFTTELTPTPLTRDRVEQTFPGSDAAVFDARRGRSAKADAPTAATSTTAANGTSSVAPAPTAMAPTTIGSRSGGLRAPGVTSAATLPGTVPAPAATTPVASVPGSTVAGAPASTTASPSTTGASTAATVTAPTPGTSGTRGLVYWYYVLAGRMPSLDAWHAVLAWNGDTTTSTLTSSGACVDATIATADDAGHAGLLQALQAWAAGAPPEAHTSVSDAGTTSITVHSCDPGPGATTSSSTSIEPFGAAESEIAVVSGMVKAGLPRSEGTTSCVIDYVRFADPPTLVEPKGIDSSLVEPTLDQTSQAAEDIMRQCTAGG